MKRLGRITVVAAFAFGGWTAGAAATAAPAFACPISPGTSTCVPDPLTVSPTATLVQGTGGTITTCPATPCFVADWVENIYRDPATNALGCTNCLTWVVQVTNRPPGPNQPAVDLISRVTIGNFSGFLTDMGVETNTPPPGSPPFTSGTNAPNNVERSASGGVLAWDFNCPGPPACTTTNEIGPGQTSVLLEVETNAQQVVPGNISIQNETAGTQPALGPAVPEALWVPALGLFGGALAGGYVIRRRRASSKNLATG